MKRKVRGYAVFLLASTLWMIPSLASAARFRDDGDEPGEPLAGSTAALVFVGIPVATGLIISLMVLAPGWFKRNAREFSSLTPQDPLFLDEKPNRKAIAE